MGRKIIIDTDPGVDDILALLLAFATLPEELEVLLVSVTYGNIDLQNCLRNVVSLFFHIEKEITWRKEQGRKAGFETLRRSKPLVAVGPNHPLKDDQLMADFFHGRDGLGNIHATVRYLSLYDINSGDADILKHPHMTPDDAWKTLFSSDEKAKDPVMATIADELPKRETLFEASKIPAHQEILRLLRKNEPDTISIVAIGPLTNLALAAAEDPEAFLRVKEVVVMGGTIDQAGNVSSPTPSSQQHSAIQEPPYRLIKAPPGPIRDLLNERNQITPVAEFNTFADAYAAARVYALTSPNPHTTMPPTPPAPPGTLEGSTPPPFLTPYPAKLSQTLSVTLFPLDITERHLLTRGEYRKTIEPLVAAESPLAQWTSAFMTSTFDKVASLQLDVSGDAVPLQLHDPLCVWYCMVSAGELGWRFNQDVDIRVETSGQWTRGMCVIDRRTRKKREDKDLGNRLARCIGTPGEKTFGAYMLKRIFEL